MTAPQRLLRSSGIRALCFASVVVLFLATTLQMATGNTAARRSARPHETTSAVEAESLPAGMPKSFVDQAQESIARQEYEASRTEFGLQAPNRAHNLRTYFEPWGVRVEDRTAPGRPELFRMRTARIGREGRMATIASGVVSSTGARVENRREGGVVEWYENGERGLEHGYVLDRRPAGEGVLQIDVAVEAATVGVRGDRAVIRTGTGRQLEYGKLSVVDATGRSVAATLGSGSDGAVRLSIEDDGAVYPLVVDPLLTNSTDTMIESDQVGGEMGSGVAFADVNGDGYADAIVGAVFYDAGQTDEGAAFIFHGGPSGIASANPTGANTTIQSNQVGAELGFSVASAGDVNGDGYDDIIIGADNYTAGQTNEGAAFVYHGGPSGIPSGNPTTANATLQSDLGSANLGISVAGAGDVNGDGYADVIVGAPLYNAGQMNEGAAFVFHGGPSGIVSGNPGTANATLQSDQVNAQLGASVAGAGDVNGDGFADVIVGAYLFSAGQTNEGAAFIFHGGPGGISNGNPGTANTTLQSDQASADLGLSVACAGDVNGDGYADVIVGANLFDAGQADEGAALVFHGGPSGVPSGNTSIANALLQSDQGNAQMGWSVAGAGDVNGDGFADVIVGSRLFDASQADEGAAFVYYGGALGILNGNPTTANASLKLGQNNGQVGWSVAGGGDVNGDGYSDVIVGALFFDSGQTDEGAAFVSLGGAEGVRSGSPVTAPVTIQSDQIQARLGSSVAGAGDVNGDGFADVIIGARLYDAGQMDEGAAFVFLGSPTGIVSGNPGSANATLESDQVNAQMGNSVAGAGDINGDGYADVIVGANLYDAGQTDEGAAFIYFGGPSGIMSGNPASANSTIQSDQASAQLGDSVAGAGDVNGDGFGDVIVGASFYTSSQANEGAAFVYHGSASGIMNGTPLGAIATLLGNQGNAGMGYSVAGAGDVNGDGYADVITGARFYSNGQAVEGAAFIFQGGAFGVPNGNPLTANAVLESDQGSAEMGNSVAGAGDVNGDSYADVIVGARAYDSGQTDEGAAFVFLGGPSGVASANPTGASATLESDQAFAFMGDTVAGAGDVNGDGYADVIVGAVLYDMGQADEGVACIFHGGPSGIASGTPVTANSTFQSDQSNAQMGPSAGVGDVNGDGYADVIVGSRTITMPETFEGAAFVFYGNGDGTGRPVRAQQLRGGGSPVNVEPWGSSLAPDFQVQLKATHPAGRGRVKLEIEVAPSGETWGGPNSITVVSPTWTDVMATPGGVTLTQTVAGLPMGFTLFHWRARVLFAPQTFMASPIAPRHGPWRRVRGQAVESDIRIINAPCMLTCPPDIMTTNDVGQCSAVVTFAPTTMGMCGTVSCSPPSGTAFPVGVTPVMCSETFGSMCSFMVTVTDTEPPTVMCPADIMTGTDPGQCSAMVTYATPTAMDNCPGATVNCVPPSGSVFATGATMVNCTAMDVGLNTAMCSFMVTVNDTEPPTVTCPADVTQATDIGQCSAVVNYTTPPAMDNCPGATVNCVPTSGSTFPTGATMVTCTATDAALNTGMCSFMVTVNDTEPPALVCPSNIIATTDPGQCTAAVSYVTPGATDNCPGATVNCSPLSGTLFPQGVTTVTCTAMDGASNTTPCTFTVTVNDNQPPSVTCPADIAVNAGPGQCSAIVTYVTPTATDNCPGAIVNCVPASGLSFPQGVTTVTCTAMDSVAMATCTFMVTVTDNQAPTLVCPADILQGLAPGETSSVVNYATPTVIDNCPGSSTAVCTPASGSTFAVGTTTVTCSATDASSNMTTCAFTVTLDESVAPPGTADITLVATSAPSISAPGAVVTYTITATNNGPAAAPNLTITDELPPEVTYSSHTASPGATVSAPPVDTNGTVTAVWPGDTPVGETRTLTITVAVSVLTPDGALIVNSPTVSSGLPDVDPSNNGSTANVDVDVNEAAVRADLSITISGGGTEVNTGDVVTYQIEVFNAGPDDAQDVQVLTTVPNGTRFSSITLSQGTATTPPPGATGMIVCSLGTIANGGSATILIEVVVRSDGGEFLTNSATVQSSTVDPVASNNSRPDLVFVNEGTMILLSWDPPDQTDDDRTLPPLHLQTTNIGGRGQSLVVALRQAQSVARRNTLIGFNIYRSNTANVATTPANLYSSTPPNITSANVTAAPGGSFFTVTAVYPNGESNGANEATGGLPEPTITGVRVKGGKLLIDGSNFGNAPVVFVDGIPFTKAVKAKPAKSRLVQKGTLLTGQSVSDYVNSRNGVVLVSVYNSAIGIGTYLYTR